MHGENRRGFNWKEVAKVLRISRAEARITFWREIKSARSKRIEAQAPAVVSRDETDSDTLKLGKARASR